MVIVTSVAPPRLGGARSPSKVSAPAAPLAPDCRAVLRCPALTLHSGQTCSILTVLAHCEIDYRRRKEKSSV